MNRKEQQEHVTKINGPLLHEALLIGDRVRVEGLDVEGEVTGTSSHYLVAMYIITVAPEDAIVREGYSKKATTFCCCHSMLTLVRT